jgi:DNA-directed RNA polymerase subunit beta'
VQDVDKNDENEPFHRVLVQNRILKKEYKVPLALKLLVKVGQKVSVGEHLSNGTVDLKEYLRIVGLDNLRNYFVKEVQKVYRIQGIEIADKYIEIILRQMTNK